MAAANQDQILNTLKEELKIKVAPSLAAQRSLAST
jgi:hypothetical protein